MAIEADRVPLKTAVQAARLRRHALEDRAVAWSAGRSPQRLEMDEMPRAAA